MTRQPAPEQLELSNEMCDIKYLGDFKAETALTATRILTSRSRNDGYHDCDAVKLCAATHLNICTIYLQFMLSGVEVAVPWSKLEK